MGVERIGKGELGDLKGLCCRRQDGTWTRGRRVIIGKSYAAAHKCCHAALGANRNYRRRFSGLARPLESACVSNFGLWLATIKCAVLDAHSAHEGHVAARRIVNSIPMSPSSAQTLPDITEQSPRANIPVPCVFQLSLQSGVGPAPAPSRWTTAS